MRRCRWRPASSSRSPNSSQLPRLRAGARNEHCLRSFGASDAALDPRAAEERVEERRRDRRRLRRVEADHVRPLRQAQGGRTHPGRPEGHHDLLQHQHDGARGSSDGLHGPDGPKEWRNAAMTRNLLGIVSALLVAAMSISAVIAGQSLPADLRLPVHWDLSGAPDDWADKWVGLLTPAGITAAVGLLFWFLPVLEPRARNFSRSQGLYLWGWLAILLFGVA